jgi:hypothetical protein
MSRKNIVFFSVLTAKSFKGILFHDSHDSKPNKFKIIFLLNVSFIAKEEYDLLALVATKKLSCRTFNSSSVKFDMPLINNKSSTVDNGIKKTESNLSL